MMKSPRKQILVDKKFQLKMSLKAVIYPLVVILSISGVLLYFSIINNNLTKESNGYINEVIENQVKLIGMFLETPALQDLQDPKINEGTESFQTNIGKLKKIDQNSKTITNNESIILYFLVAMTIVQTIIIFSLFIFFSHKISGPLYVITNYLKEIRGGTFPKFRPLRKNDELVEFYEEFRVTMEYLEKQLK
ncbi:MAG: hypothetical protein GY754_27860 [bacterium]|nr:hypothetical protein [bacterium]